MANGRKLKGRKPPIRSPTPPPIADDDESDLMNLLLDQLGESRDETVQAESAALLNDMDLNGQADKIDAQSKKSAKDRFKARQARKAAALAESFSPDDPAAEARLQKEAVDEEEAINRICKQLNVSIHQINPDGHCLFSAIADQLALLGVVPPEQAKYDLVRVAAANYIYTHPDDFLPFLPSAEGEALGGGLMSPGEFEDYCKSIQNTALWGGEPEILALSRVFNVPIQVIQAAQPHIVIHDPSPNNPSTGKIAPAKISYHRRMYGLGEHYNSLRPIRAASS